MRYYIETARNTSGYVYEIMCVGEGKIAESNKADYAYKIADWLNGRDPSSFQPQKPAPHSAPHSGAPSAG